MTTALPTESCAGVAVELRCASTLHGRVTDQHVLEVACRSLRCKGSLPRGTVVRHYIDIRTGEVIRTRYFRDPRPEREPS